MPTLQPTSTEDDIEGLVVLLLNQGSKTDAIALVQEVTGAAPQEARRLVSDISDRHAIAQPRLWLLTVAVALGLIGGAMLFVIAG